MEEKLVLFEIKQTPKAENLKEMYFHYFFKRTSSIILICFFSFYGLVGLGLLGYNLSVGRFDFYALLLTLLALGALAYRFISYRSFSKLAFKRGEELGAISEVVMHVGRESMYPEEHPESALHLSDVKRAYTTKNLIYLVTRAKQIVVFEKESFTVGDGVDFLAHLAERGVKVPKKY